MTRNLPGNEMYQYTPTSYSMLPFNYLYTMIPSTPISYSMLHYDTI